MWMSLGIRIKYNMPGSVYQCGNQNTGQVDPVGENTYLHNSKSYAQVIKLY